MSKPHGIIILGANGSGKSTLGRELARVLNFAHFDAEEYYWRKTDMPFTVARSHKERQEMLLSDIEKQGSFVMSGDVSNWGEQFLPLFDLVVFLSVPTDIRMERIERREFERFGDRIRKGGDMYEQHLGFIEFAASRSIALLEQRASEYLCPVLRVDGTEDYRTNASRIAERFYTRHGEPWRATIAHLNELEKYRFTVVFAQYGKVGGKWLYCRHKDRDTWETPGGHIEAGEMPLDCAKRELYEETGATKFDIHPAFDYSVHTATEFSYGQVFFADIETLGDIPLGSEMAEVKPFDTIPDKLTYPSILPVLYEKMQSWLYVGRVEV